MNALVGIFYWNVYDLQNILQQQGDLVLFARRAVSSQQFAGIFFWLCLFCGQLFPNYFRNNVRASGVGVVGYFLSVWYILSKKQMLQANLQVRECVNWREVLTNLRAQQASTTLTWLLLVDVAPNGLGQPIPLSIWERRRMLQTLWIWN